MAILYPSLSARDRMPVMLVDFFCVSIMRICKQHAFQIQIDAFQIDIFNAS